MVALFDLVDTLEDWMQPQRYQDFCPNGLQVQGADEVSVLVTGVSANQALIQAAVAQQASVLLVHHGFFWKGESPCLTGLRYARIAPLIRHNISLIAYHLPLDGHATWGNNVQLAERLGITEVKSVMRSVGPGVLCQGTLPGVSGAVFEKKIAAVLGQDPFYIPGRDTAINRIAWSTGAAQDSILEAAALGVDAFLTGEVSERTVALAEELGIHFYAAGHHATERYGVEALGEALAAHYGLSHTFIDIPNPI